MNTPSLPVDLAAPVNGTLPPACSHIDAERIVFLENRVRILELELIRFQKALISAGEFMFKNPASKMMMMAFPKEMQERLREFFDGKA